VLRSKLPKRRVRLPTEASARRPRREPGLFFGWPHLRPIPQKFAAAAGGVAAYLPARAACVSGHACFGVRALRASELGLENDRRRPRPPYSPNHVRAYGTGPISLQTALGAGAAS
jgi:hypothetical protein